MMGFTAEQRPQLVRGDFGFGNDPFIVKLEERKLRQAGAQIVTLDLPEASEIDAVFRSLVPVDLLAFLGRERMSQQWQRLDPVAAWNSLASQNTRPCNLFDQCGISLPIHQLGSDPPVGLQLCASNGEDESLLEIALGIENLLMAE